MDKSSISITTSGSSSTEGSEDSYNCKDRCNDKEERVRTIAAGGSNINEAVRATSNRSATDCIVMIFIISRRYEEWWIKASKIHIV